jgi:hypothetical protein
MSRCSPCFNDFVAFREQAKRSPRRRVIGSVAAIVVLGLAIWAVYRYIDQHRRSQVTYQTNLLDLREKSALRGVGANASVPPTELPRSALALSIYLPVGSEPGQYEVQIVEQPTRPLITAEGTAALRDHITVLKVKVDLQRLHSGLYLVGIRQAGWSWAFYPVVLK